MTRDRSAVISMPRSRNGQERSRIAPLKNTWMIWSTLALPGEAGLDPAARDDHRQEKDQIGELAHRERRRVARLARAGGCVVDDLVHRHHGAECGALGDGNHAV